MAAPFIILSLLLLMEQGGQGGMDNIPLSINTRLHTTMARVNTVHPAARLTITTHNPRDPLLTGLRRAR
ncbi:hypothetical protein VCV18_002109 [Metarhizium anisopliae]